MKIIKRILIVLAVIIVLLLVVAAIMPKTYMIERSLVIKAPKETIMAQVSNFRQWETWSPWIELDTTMTMTYSETQGTIGSWYKWKGNDDAGEGSMTIKQLTPDMMECELAFIKPFKSTPSNYFKFEPDASGTKVTWGMKGEMPFPMNLMSFMMKSNVEKQFDKGLKKLATVAENAPAVTTAENTGSAYTINAIDFNGKSYIGIRKTVKFSEIGKFFQDNMPKLAEACKTNKMEMTGAPAGLYFSWDPAKMETDMAAAVPVATAKDMGKDIKAIHVAGSKAFYLDYWGSYDKSEQAHNAMSAYVKEHNMTQQSPVIEEYITDPMNEKDTAKWLTKIYYLVK